MDVLAQQFPVEITLCCVGSLIAVDYFHHRSGDALSSLGDTLSGYGFDFTAYICFAKSTISICFTHYLMIVLIALLLTKELLNN